MAGTKRKSIGLSERQTAVKARRRSPRLELKPIEIVDTDKYDVPCLNEFLNKTYNRFFQFAQHTSNDGPARQAASNIRKRVDRIQRILDEANKLVLEHGDELQNEVHTSRREISCSEHWFLNGNILSFPLEEMKRAFRSGGPLDAKVLHSYLHRLFSEEAARVLHSDEYVNKYDPYHFQGEHAKRVLWLVDQLYCLPQGQQYAFDIAISYSTDVLRCIAEDGSPYRLVRRYLATKLGFEGRQSRSEGDRLSIGERYRRYSLLADSKKRPSETLPPFLDIGELARRVRCAYLRTESGEIRPCQYIDGDELNCFHTEAISLLRLLQQSAYSEIRGKAMLTIGTVLPSELVEEIVEYALVAEGLPAAAKSMGSRRKVLKALSIDDPCRVMEEIKKEKKLYR